MICTFTTEKRVLGTNEIVRRTYQFEFAFGYLGAPLAFAKAFAKESRSKLVAVDGCKRLSTPFSGDAANVVLLDMEQPKRADAIQLTDAEIAWVYDAPHGSLKAI